MITKQELEEKITHGKSVWYLFNEIYEIKTNEHTNKYISKSDDYCYTDKKGVNRCCPLDMLYKSKIEAEHYLNHQDITRTETLPFLTWEEIKHNNYMNFRGNDGYNYELQVFIGTMLGDNIIRLLNTSIGICGFSSYATEENFYKAYDKCVKLFKGDEI